LFIVYLIHFEIFVIKIISIRLKIPRV